ncbi:MAG: InlB B-repeat-containing protein, partial [Oscillospiraceae bacterium]|nr:InlB B-repeat-containing protein [Oscillospiraceae bacterium]
MKHIRKVNKALLNSLITDKTKAPGYQYVKLKRLSKRSIALIMTASLMLGLIAFIPGAVYANEGTEPEIIVGSSETNAEQNSEPTPQPSPEPGVDDDSDEDNKDDESGRSEPGEDNKDNDDNEEDDDNEFEDFNAISMELEFAEEIEELLELSATSLGGPTINISARTLNSRDIDGTWNYVQDFQYITHLSVDSGGTGTDRIVRLEAPDGMRFVRPTVNIDGVTVDYSADYTSTNINYGKYLLIRLAPSFSGNLGIDIITTAAASGASPSADVERTALNIGSIIYDWGKAGNRMAPKSITTATSTGEWSCDAPSGTLILNYQTYRYNNIFNGLYLTALNIVTRDSAIMRYDGQIIYQPTTTYFIHYWGTTVADRNGWALLDTSWVFANRQENPKNPYWDLNVKVYIPEGLKVSNPAYTVHTDSSGLRWVEFTEADHTSAQNLNKQKSPIRGAHGNSSITHTTYVYGSGGNYFTNENNGATMALNLGLVLDDGVRVEPNRTFDASPTEISFKTFDENGNAIPVSFTVNGPTVETPALKQIDAYQLTGVAVDIAAGATTNTETNSGRPLRVTSRFSMNNLNYGGHNENYQHKGGTLTLEFNPSAYQIHGFNVNTARGNYFARGSGNTSTNGIPTALDGVLINHAMRGGMPGTTKVEYYLANGAGPFSAAVAIDNNSTFRPVPTGDRMAEIIDRHGRITHVNFPTATDTNRVQKVVFTLTDGLNLPPGWAYSFGFDITAEVGLPDNVTGDSGLHRSNIKMTLRGINPCTIQGGASGDSAPAIAGGAHTFTQDVNIRSLSDLLIVQSQGVYFANSHNLEGLKVENSSSLGVNATTTVNQTPFLNDSPGGVTVRSGTLAFGLGVPGTTTNYTARQGAWPIYYDFEMALGNSTYAEKRYIETIASFNAKGVMWTNARVEYTTNLHPGGRTITLANTSIAPDSITLPGADYFSVQWTSLDLASDEYLTGFVFRADEFKIGYVNWNTSTGNWGWTNAHPFGGRWNVDHTSTSPRGAGMTFCSHTDRNFRSDGTPIPDAIEDYEKSLVTFALNAKTRGALEKGGPIVHERESFNMTGGALPILFRKALPIAINEGSNTTPAFFAHTTAAGTPATAAQGSTFSFTLTTRGNTTGSARNYVPIFNSYVWAKVNPSFSVVNITSVGWDGYWETVSVNGDTWLKIFEGEDVTDVDRTYTIFFMVLPTALPGQTRYFEENPFRTIDRGESFERSWALTAAPRYIYATGYENFVPDVLGLYNGKNGPKEGYVYSASGVRSNFTATYQSITVMQANVSGVRLLSGLGTAYSGIDATRTFRDSQAGQLTAYASIGNGSNANMTNYETVFSIPRLGEAMTHTAVAPSTSTATTADFGLLLRGPVRLTLGGVDAALTYKIGDTWLSESAVTNSNAWRDVTEVKVVVPTLPAGTTVAVAFTLDIDGDVKDLNIGDTSLLTAKYSSSATGGNVNIANAARFKLEGYRIASTSNNAGYAFNDLNNDDIFTSADRKRAGMTVELWASDTNGVLLGGSPVATTTTDTNGVWAFTNQRSGFYVAAYVLPAGFKFATQGPLTTANASHVNPATGHTGVLNATGTADVTVSQNAGLQSSYLVKVRFVDSITEKQVGDTIEYPGITGVNTVTPGVTANVNIPYGFNLTGAASQSKTLVFSTSAQDTLAEFVFLVSRAPVAVRFYQNHDPYDMALYEAGNLVNTNKFFEDLLMPFDNPERQGYIFDGWYDLREGGKRYTPRVDIIDVTGTLSLYAQWKEMSRHNIVFDAGEGLIGGEKTYLVDNVLQGSTLGETDSMPPAIPVRYGFTFKGWNTSPDGNGANFRSDSPITSDLILHAVWAEVTGAWIDGIVTDENGKALEGILVRLMHRGSDEHGKSIQEAKTNEYGYFIFESLPLGNYSLVYIDEARDVQITANVIVREAIQHEGSAVMPYGDLNTVLHLEGGYT